jgi:hypothetical protein
MHGAWPLPESNRVQHLQRLATKYGVQMHIRSRCLGLSVLRECSNNIYCYSAAGPVRRNNYSKCTRFQLLHIHSATRPEEALTVDMPAIS